MSEIYFLINWCLFRGMGGGMFEKLGEILKETGTFV